MRLPLQFAITPTAVIRETTLNLYHDLLIYGGQINGVLSCAFADSLTIVNSLIQFFNSFEIKPLQVFLEED